MYQKLLTKEILDNLPPLYSQEKVKDPTVWVKFFTPDAQLTWLATEYSPEEQLFFGYVKNLSDPDMSELGYFSLSELRKIRGRFGLPIERDMHFDPMPLSAARKDELAPAGFKPTRYVAKQRAKTTRKSAASGLGTVR